MLHTMVRNCHLNKSLKPRYIDEGQFHSLSVHISLICLVALLCTVSAAPLYPYPAPYYGAYAPFVPSLRCSCTSRASSTSTSSRSLAPAVPAAPIAPAIPAAPVAPASSSCSCS
ncbi:hypothetical protein CEXT_263561 [Caerostris extrusa]|uniref:Uncharacterized protein n=1 Tax=Caerostris extrusa TaxID=172846 RepID=A0AAV4Y980_CAEEX|nr:hypothetical protein CEXT_263561 [Caerostris extrusa]